MKTGSRGVGGWLIIPTIISIFGALGFAYFSLRAIFNFNLIILATYLPSALLLIYTLVLEFQKKKEFKKWIILSLWLPIGFLFISEVLMGSEGTMAHYLPMIFSSAIWTSYFKKSKRVKNTFVK